VSAFDGWRKGRVIDLLRADFGGTWRYDAQEHIWHGETFDVQSYGESAPAHEGDDSWRTTYRRSDTSAQVLIGRGRLHHDE
jgi:hypothetical protein